MAYSLFPAFYRANVEIVDYHKESVAVRKGTTKGTNMPLLAIHPGEHLPTN